MTHTLIVAAVLLCLAAISPRAHAAEPAPAGVANRASEWAFTSEKAHPDPFNDVELDVLVTAPDGSQKRVPAFWAGGQAWRVRYASPQVGTHRWKSDCSDKTDAGLHAVEGSIKIKPYTGDNPLFRHGFVRVASDKRHFEHADGTPFFWLGDTWWMGLCHRLKFPEDFEKLAADRRAKGFNVIQIVAGLYPDMHPFDARGANEAGFPWEKEYTSIRPEYFDAADKRIEHLVDQGLSPCIVGAWGYYMPWMGAEKMKKHWRYLIARWGAMPVIWCAAGEANLPWYLVKGFPYDDRKAVTGWTEVMRYIRATDPDHHPLTIHPTGIGRLSARVCTEDVALLDFDMLQTPHGERAAVPATISNVRDSYADKPVMPVINGEASYERLMDSIRTEWTRQMFWICVTNGAAGHTYGANGIWQVNRKGQPHGPSPHHPAGSTGYGVIPWDEAMNLPGSSQVALGKKLFEQYPWQKFEPHSDWARYDDADGGNAAKARWGQWIWFPEGDPTADAPVAKRYFRKTFELPEDAKPKSGALWISVDDRFAATLNGTQVGAHKGHESPQRIDVMAALRSGKNVLDIEAENLPAAVPANPAGLIASLRIQTAEGKEIAIASDESWQVAKEPLTDANASPAKVLGAYGSKPWGKFPASSTYGPFATGIAGKVRIIYVPDSKPIRVLNLEAGAKYTARVVDPVDGTSAELGAVSADAKNSWLAEKPETKSGAADWVLVVEQQMEGGR